MKKLFLSLAILISLSVSAHTLTGIGYCTTEKEAVFQASFFGRIDSVEVEYKMYNTSTWLTLPKGKYVTSSNSALNNIVIGIPQSDINQPVTIRYRWKTRNSNGSYTNWSSWSTAVANKIVFTKCGDVFSLPVKFSYFAVKRLDPETLAIVFTTYETENVKYFHITVSDDGKSWRRIVVVMPNTYNPNGTYTTQVKIKTLKK